MAWTKGPKVRITLVDTTLEYSGLAKQKILSNPAATAEGYLFRSIITGSPIMLLGEDVTKVKFTTESPIEVIRSEKRDLVFTKHCVFEVEYLN